MGFFDWIYSFFAPSKADDNPWFEVGGDGWIKKYLDPYDRKEYQIYERFDVAGIWFRMPEALEWANGRNLSVELVRESNNAHDRNAIKVLGKSDRGVTHIGYVPKALAKKVATTGVFDGLKPRLIELHKRENVYNEEKDEWFSYLYVSMQIIGPKATRDRFFKAV
jgi:hypothetical protein